VDPTRWNAKLRGFEAQRWKIVRERDLSGKNCGVFLMEGACDGIWGDLRMKCDIMLS